MVKRGAWRGAIVARSGARRAREGGPAIGEGECESLRENEEDGKEHGRPARRKTRRRVSYSRSGGEGDRNTRSKALNSLEKEVAEFPDFVIDKERVPHSSLNLRCSLQVDRPIKDA